VTARVAALVGRMLYAGLKPEQVANTTGVDLAEVLRLEAEIEMEAKS